MKNYVVNFKARFNTSQFNAGIKQVTQHVNQAAQQMKTLTRSGGGAMNQMTSGAANTQAALASMNTQVARMHGPIDSLANSVRKGDMTFRQLGQAMRNNKEITQQQVALQRGQIEGFQLLSNGMVKVQFSTQALGASTVKLSQRVGVAAASIAAASNRLVNFGKNLQWAGRQITVGLTVPLGFMAARAMKAAEEYDKAMTRVIKVTNFTAEQGTEAFLRQEEALRTQIRTLGNLGTQMGFTSTETAEAAAEFAQMGYQSTQLDALTDASQRLAFTSGTEMSDAIELSRITVQAFKKDLDELVPTFAKLNMIENNTALSLDEMTKALPVVASVAHELGLEIEETAGLMAMMKEAGIGANEGATALRTGLIRIVQEASDPAIAAFERIGISLEGLQARHKGDTLGFFDELGRHLQNLDDQAAKSDFTAAIGKLTGTRQAARFLSFLQEVPNRTREGTVGFRAWMGATADTAEAMATFNFELQQVSESAAGTAERLRAELTTALEQAGHPFLQLANLFRQFAVNVIDWYNNLGPVTQGIMKWGLAAIAITGPIMMLIGILANFFGSISKGVATFVRWSTGMRLVTSEQAILDTALKRGIITQESYNASLMRGVTLQEQLARAERMRMLNPNVVVPPGRQMLEMANVPGNHPTHLAGMTATQAQAKAAGIGRGAGGALMAAGGIAATASLITDVTSKTATWEKTLMKAFVGATLFAPLFKKIASEIAFKTLLTKGWGAATTQVLRAIKLAIGPIGWIAIAIGGIVAGVWQWRKHQDAVWKRTHDTNEEAKKLAENIGLAWKQGEGVEDSMKTAAARADEARRENAKLADELKKLNNEGDRARVKQRIHEIGAEMVWAGNDPETVEKQLRTWAEEMNLGIEVELITKDLFGQETLLRQQVKDWGRELRDLFNSAWLEKAGVQGLEETAIKHQADMIANIINSGDADAAWQAGIKINEAMQMIMKSTDVPRTQAEALKVFFDTLEESSKVDFEMPDFSKDYLALGDDIEEFVKRVLETGDVLPGFMNQSRLAVEQYAALLKGILGESKESLEEMLANAVVARAGLMSTFISVAQNKDEIARLDHLIDALNMALKETHVAGGDAGDGLGDAASGADELVTAAEKAKTAISALRSSMGEVMGNITSLAAEQLSARFAAEDDMWDARLDRLKDAQDKERELLEETHEAEMQRIEDEWDAKVKAVEDVEEEEDELERARQHRFRMQKLRDDYENRRAQGRLGVAAALARGEVDEAARINQEMRAAATEYGREAQKAETEFTEESRKREREATIEAYEAGREAAIEALEAEQEAQSEALDTSQKAKGDQVDASRKAAQQHNEIIKKQFDHEIEQWKKYTPRNEREYQQHLGRLAEIMNRFGMTDLTSIASQYQQIFGDSLYNGFKFAVSDATTALAEDKRWNEAGKVIGKALIAGILGEEWRSPAQQGMRIGTADAWDETRNNNAPASGRMAPRGTAGSDRRLHNRFHSGGMVDRSGSGAGLKPGEQQAVLQTGEYVMDRKTVTKFGPDFFKGLQRFHSGGLVDHIGDMAPISALAHTLGQVLSGRPLETTGNIGAAMYEAITGQGLMDTAWAETGAPAAMQVVGGLGDLRPPDRDQTWREANWKVGMDPHVIRTTAGILAAIPGGQPVTSALRRGAIVKGTNRPSLHGKGKAVDIGVRARRDGGSLAEEQIGDQIAATFRKAPGIKEVLWKTMTGGNHYNHVHAGFYHKGGLVPQMSVPALAAGADINFDNTLANLHRGERVLTAPLTNKLDEGLSKLANGGGVVYDVDVVVQGSATKDDANSIANAVIRKLQQQENRQGRSRKVG